MNDVFVSTSKHVVTIIFSDLNKNRFWEILNRKQNPTDAIKSKRTTMQVNWGGLKFVVSPFINNS